jgi:long-chain acyl-CoA synthetase
MNARPWFASYPPGMPHELPLPTRSMIDVFETSVARDPEGPAVYYFDEVVSSRRLDDLATRFATLLESWGLTKGDRIALYLQNVPQYLVAMYGAWKRGCIIVPLNPMLKEKELTYHLTDSGARVLVALDSLWEVARDVVGKTKVEHTLLTNQIDFLAAAHRAASFPPLAASKKLRFAEAPDLLDTLAATAPTTTARVPVGPDDVASFAYTSGTTGQPKASMNTQGNIVYNGEVYREWMNMTSRDVILGVAPLFHITGMVGHLALGASAGCPVILQHRFDTLQAFQLIERWKPTMTVGSITVFLALMNHPEAARFDLGSLTKCFSGGAPIAPAVTEQFAARFGVYIHNIYGLTESTSPIHGVPLGTKAPVDSFTGALSVGVPVPGCDARLVDLTDPDKPAEAGEAGELAVKGPMIFKGYWNKPEASAAAFRDGYFLTGDVAAMDDDGFFFVIDRKKDMINVSGFKVWPREVEDTLYQHASVKEAAVIGIADEYRGETVKAYVSLKTGTTATPEELIEFCKSRIAAYKYPRIVEVVEEIPKTTTGKFLRRSMRDKHAADTTKKD